MAFDPKNLAPAASVEAFAKGGPRTVKQVAIDNLDKMLALHKDPKAEGKRHFESKGEVTKFSVRVNNTALNLEVYVDGKPALAREVSVPTKLFPDALAYYRAQLVGDKYADQLKALGDKREARTVKMRATRAAKKGDTKPKA